MLKEEAWMKVWLEAKQNWTDALNNVKPGTVFEDQYIVFYDEPFSTWAMKLFKKE